VLWVFVFGGIAVAGLVMLVGYAVWLAHKTADVLSEATVVSERIGALGLLASQIEMPAARPAHGASPSRTTGQDGLGSE